MYNVNLLHNSKYFLLECELVNFVLTNDLRLFISYEFFDFLEIDLYDCIRD